jgi:hypothetical protein
MNLLLNSQSDIEVVDGALPLVEGIDEIAQQTKQQLSASVGDWFLDIEQGLPYFQLILKKTTTLSAIEGIYLTAIAKIPGIVNVNSFTLDFEPTTRALNIIFSAQTREGVLNFNLAEA